MKEIGQKKVVCKKNHNMPDEKKKIKRIPQKLL